LRATNGNFAESSKTAVVMTHSLTTVAEALLHPERFYSVTELRDAPTLIPQKGGVYAWWFSKVPPGGPVASSTLRRTLAVLLKVELDLSISRTKAGKLKMSREHEARLTQWMDENAQVLWAVSSAPWGSRIT
jgi:hypothetical protein